MNRTTVATVMTALVGLAMCASELRAAPPIQVNCRHNPSALSELLLSGVVVDGDRLAISGTCVEPPGGPKETFEITNDITLDGKGNAATLMGGGPVLTIALSKTVVVQDLTITGGDTGGPSGNNIPAGVANNGTLTLITSSVTGNSDLGGVGSTGGILNAGTLTLIDSSVNGNDVRSGGLPTGGILNNAGCTVTLVNSEVSLNNADTQGGPGTGGIHNQGVLILSNSTVSENDAFNGTDVTGGIRNSGGTVMLMGSIVSKNIAEDGSVSSPPVGGILNDGGTVSLSNSTISKNVADGNGCGTCVKAVGGIYNNSIGVDTLVLTNTSTVSKNTAVGTGDNVGGIASIAGVPLPNIVDSIVKNNTPRDCNFIDPACIVAP